MNQYIITEELLKQFEKACPRYSTTPDHFIIDRDTMVAEVRSRPYNPQAERERVLDEAIKHLKKREYHSPLLDVDFSLAIRVLEELRQKDGE